MIKFLKLFHADLVLFGNGSQRLAAGHDMSITIARCRMRGFVRRCRSIRNWAWRRLPNHHSRTRNLLFQLQNLLGKRVDLGVGLIDLFFKRGNLVGRWGTLRRLSQCVGDHE